MSTIVELIILQEDNERKCLDTSKLKLLCSLIVDRRFCCTNIFVSVFASSLGLSMTHRKVLHKKCTVPLNTQSEAFSEASTYCRNFLDGATNQDLNFFLLYGILN